VSLTKCVTVQDS